MRRGPRYCVPVQDPVAVQWDGTGSDGGASDHRYSTAPPMSVRCHAFVRGLPVILPVRFGPASPRLPRQGASGSRSGLSWTGHGLPLPGRGGGQGLA